jgi:hypothetical protein
MDGRQCKIQYFKEPYIDTVNTIRWLINELPSAQCDSNLLWRKIKYAHILYKFGEIRLNSDTIKTIRLLFPEDIFEGHGKWWLCKILFLKDSTVSISKTSDIADTVGRMTLDSKSKKLKPKESESLFYDLKILEKYQGYECFRGDYFPYLLEYYDGKQEHCYILSGSCKEDKELWKQYGKLINKVINLSNSNFRNFKKQ